MKKRIVAVSGGVVALLGLTTGSAQAATESSYSLSYCYSGSHQGVGTNDLSNGVVRMGWCSSGEKATTVTVRYTKESGSTVSAQFGYRWTNSDGGNIGGTHYDTTGAVSIKAGETWSARFKRSPAQAPPNGQDCIQGLIKVKGQGTFPTHTVCR